MDATVAVSPSTRRADLFMSSTCEVFKHDRTLVRVWPRNQACLATAAVRLVPDAAGDVEGLP